MKNTGTAETTAFKMSLLNQSGELVIFNEIICDIYEMMMILPFATISVYSLNYQSVDRILQICHCNLTFDLE